MKNLFLIRHAKSSWSDPTVTDFERGLNKRGKRDAPFMAEILSKSGAKPDLILSSPAKRAKKTACMMADGVGYPHAAITFDHTIYSASAEELVRLLQRTDDNVTVLFLIGHNYAITDLAVLLTRQTIENIPTSGIVSIECNVKKWREVAPGCGSVVFFDYPKRYTIR